MINIKEYRNNEMKWLAVLYGALYLYFCTDFVNIISTYSDSKVSLLSKTIESVFLAGIIPIIVYIFDNLLSSKSKNWLLGSCIISPYGYTVFSKISSGKFNDDRVSCETAKTKYEKIIINLPQNKKSRMKYENEKWNELYAGVESNGAVIQSQRDWLACRDMYIETILFTLFYIVSILIFNNVSFSIKMLLILITMMIILNICSHNKMKRFVYTVIVKNILIS